MQSDKTSNQQYPSIEITCEVSEDLSALINAINNNDLTALKDRILLKNKHLLAQELSLIINNELTLTAPVTHYIAFKSKEYIEFLISKMGININSLTSENSTLLHYAALSGNIDTCSFLLTKGANAELETKNSETILHYASCFGSKNLLELIFKAQPRVSGDKEGFTPLHFAARYNNSDAVEILVNRNLNVKQGNNPENSITPLHEAAKYNRDTVIPTLIRLGADITQGMSESKGGLQPIHIAVLNNSDKSIKSLKDSGININIGNKDSITALHIAALCNNTLMIKTLKDNGGDVNQGDGTGFTPLHIAVVRGHLKATIELMKCGAKVDQGTSEHISPLLLAAGKGKLDFKSIEAKFSFMPSAPYPSEEQYLEILKALMLTHQPYLRREDKFHKTAQIYAQEVKFDKIKNILDMRQALDDLINNRIEKIQILKHLEAQSDLEFFVTLNKNFCKVKQYDPANIATHFNKLKINLCEASSEVEDKAFDYNDVLSNTQDNFDSNTNVIGRVIEDIEAYFA